MAVPAGSARARPCPDQRRTAGPEQAECIGAELWRSVQLSKEQTFWVEAATGAARNPDAWDSQAELLKRAADALLAVVQADIDRMIQSVARSFADPENRDPLPIFITPAYMMLAAFALENLAKGIQVARDPNAVPPPAKNPPRFDRMASKGHLTVEMCTRDAGVALSPTEEDLVQRLEKFAELGRFPTTMQVEKMAGGGTWHDTDAQVFDGLCARMRGMLRKEADSLRARQASDDERRRRAQRATLMQELQGGQFRRVQENGAVIFEATDPGKPDDPGSLVACCACHTSFVLNPSRAAALCRCSALYHGVLYFDASLGRDLLRVERYPKQSAASARR